ncbi:hypothetical protein MA16_Dca021545 [Dendrobium catenatum]|uniref:Uncharacterized protein n=1 Tax=Dendrobium catenatum TaxID=906689 RepID=A0A2I0V9B0_9ASPA|nr:hypothetical protein MA16_Dca021545 [Dendrobium catenatum]
MKVLYLHLDGVKGCGTLMSLGECERTTVLCSIGDWWKRGFCTVGAKGESLWVRLGENSFTTLLWFFPQLFHCYRVRPGEDLTTGSPFGDILLAYFALLPSPQLFPYYRVRLGENYFIALLQCFPQLCPHYRSINANTSDSLVVRCSCWWSIG